MRTGWLVGLLAAVGLAQDPPEWSWPRLGNFQVTGPFPLGHAAVYIFSRMDQPEETGEFLPLQEAVKTGKAKLFETGEVRQIRVENLSDAWLFAGIGELIEGGRCERVMQASMIIPPKAAGPLPVFCAERGRWAGKGDPTVSGRVAPRQVREAILLRNQDRVWEAIEALKIDRRNSGLGEELARESYRMAGEKAVAELGPAIDKVPRPAGMALWADGGLVYAEFFLSPKLFRKIWLRLLYSLGAEASRASPGVAAPSAADMAATLKAAEGGMKEEILFGGNVFVRVEGQDILRYELLFGGELYVAGILSRTARK